VAVLPFLKTSRPLQIGGITFRSTDDLAGLPDAQTAAVREISDMLFLQDDLRVRSASYAIMPRLALDEFSGELRQLQRVHTVLAYLYGAPHDTFDSPFQGPNEISLAIFTPSRVSVFLVRPEHHTVSVATGVQITPDDRHQLPGYAGLYNFHHHFWVAQGSRVYGPARHVTLNIQQDLANDLDAERHGRGARDLLFALLRRPDEQELDRIYVALDWYNAAHPDVAGPDRALLNLAVAFESLLRLPRDAKTDRFVDAVSMLLGRTERLDHWARQFYEARSGVAHEGRVDQHYYVTPGPGARQTGGRFGTLLLYGRQVFRLCATALLFGMELAREHDLRERFVDNSERYAAICEALRPETGDATHRLRSIEPLIQGLAYFRFVTADAVSQGTILAAARAAAAALLESGTDLDSALTSALSALTALTRQNGEYRQLEALQNLESVLTALPFPAPNTPQRVVYDLIEQAWGVLFRRYFDLRERRA
jgi:hypothetical protein